MHDKPRKIGSRPDIITPLIEQDGRWKLVLRDRLDTDLVPFYPDVVHTHCGYIEPHGNDLRYSPNLAVPDGTASLFTEGSAYSHMTDIVGAWSKSLWYKPCFHEMLDQRVTSQRSDFSPRANGFFDMHISPTGLNVSFLKPLQQLCPFPTNDAFLDDLAAQTERKLLDYVHPVTSLMNIIIELKELCEGNIKLVKRIQGWIEALKAAYKRALKKFDSSWLAWNFAVKTSLSDLKESVNLLQAARKRIAHLKKVNHTCTTERFRKPRVWAPPAGYEFGYDIPLTGISATTYTANIDPLHERPELPFQTEDWPGRLVFVCEDYDLTYVGCGFLRYDLPDQLVDGSFECLGQMIMALQNMYNPGEWVWEAFPFSWALDDLLSERAKLDRWLQLRTILPRDIHPGTPGFDEGWAQYPLPKILATGHSFKLISGWTVFVEEPNGSRDFIGYAMYRRYQRVYGLPTRESSFFRNPFGDLYRESLVASCITQRLFRRR